VRFELEPGSGARRTRERGTLGTVAAAEGGTIATTVAAERRTIATAVAVAERRAIAERPVAERTRLAVEAELRRDGDLAVAGLVVRLGAESGRSA
jgi:hypothetical protein